jgi:hypothetical protein
MEDPTGLWTIAIYGGLTSLTLLIITGIIGNLVSKYQRYRKSHKILIELNRALKLRKAA